MKIRIRECIRKNAINYRVQVKRCLFWRTLVECNSLESAIDIKDSIIKMDSNNNPKRDKIEMNGWMVRNQYTYGISNELGIYYGYPTYEKSDSGKSVMWEGDKVAIIKYRDNLFGEIGLEPRKVRITIEKL